LAARYARLETTYPPKVGQQQPGSTPTHPPADSEVCYHNYTAPANEQGPGLIFISDQPGPVRPAVPESDGACESTPSDSATRSKEGLEGLH
jgi:hypothetical protein